MNDPTITTTRNYLQVTVDITRDRIFRGDQAETDADLRNASAYLLAQAEAYTSGLGTTPGTRLRQIMVDDWQSQAIESGVRNTQRAYITISPLEEANIGELAYPWAIDCEPGTKFFRVAMLATFAAACWPAQPGEPLGTNDRLFQIEGPAWRRIA